jgi:plastocyanin
MSYRFTYSQRGEANTMKKLIVGLVALSLVTVLAVACGGSGGGSTDVHMSSTNFVQPSVTISKGSSINLVSDAAATHVISNGYWVNGTPEPMTESGAPTVSNLQFNSAGQSQTVGPFNTAGTYHLYCSVHPGMNLVVVVH